jgi:hypothetical protein
MWDSTAYRDADAGRQGEQARCTVCHAEGAQRAKHPVHSVLAQPQMLYQVRPG